VSEQSEANRGEGASRRTRRLPPSPALASPNNLIHNPINVVENLHRTNPQSLDPKPSKISVPTCVLCDPFRMLFTVDLDTKPGSGAIKVENIRARRKLPPKPKPSDSPPKLPPKYLLSVCHIATKPLRSLHGSVVSVLKKHV